MSIWAWRRSFAMSFFMKTLNPKPWRAYEHEEEALTWRGDQGAQELVKYSRSYTKSLWNTPGATQRACEILKELTKSCEKTPLQNHNFVFSKKRDFHTNPNPNLNQTWNWEKLGIRMVQIPITEEAELIISYASVSKDIHVLYHFF